MSYTCWGNLIFLKIYKNPFFDSKSFDVILDLLMSFFLIKFPAFSFMISRFASILFQKRIQNFFSYLEIPTIWLTKLFQKLLSRLSIFIFKLRIYFTIAFKKSIITLLQIFGQCMIQSLQFKCIFLWFFHWGLNRL
jgi:hypothetical protein